MFLQWLQCCVVIGQCGDCSCSCNCQTPECNEINCCCCQITTPNVHAPPPPPATADLYPAAAMYGPGSSYPVYRDATMNPQYPLRTYNSTARSVDDHHQRSLYSRPASHSAAVRAATSSSAPARPTSTAVDDDAGGMHTEPWWWLSIDDDN